jgi:DoxX-like family
MKKDRIIYWTITGLFSAFMIFSSVGGAILQPEARQFLNHLGYPDYFIQLISYLKILGVIAILIPGFPKIKEWAYAGLCFDLLGAIVSVSAVDGFNPGIFVIVVPIGFLFISRHYFNKLYLATQKSGS